MLSWPYVHVLSERNETNYTVWEDGTVILSTVSNSFNYSTILRAPETEYNLSLSAENCAGNSKRDVCYTRPVPGLLICIYILFKPVRYADCEHFALHSSLRPSSGVNCLIFLIVDGQFVAWTFLLTEFSSF